MVPELRALRFSTIGRIHVRPKFLFFLVYEFLKQKNASGGRKIKIKINWNIGGLKKKLKWHLNQLSA